MYFADYHTHSDFSSDSDTPLEENIKQAIKLGLSEIAITDHIDFDYPDPNFPFMFDYDMYSSSIYALQKKYEKQITILIGVEIGIQPHVYSQIDDIINKNYYDFVIGSTHCINKFDLCTDEFFTGKTKHEAYRNYFEEVLRNVNSFAFFDVYGHIDFINRYGNYEDKTMHYEEFQDITDEILKALISKGKGIEINTSGFRYGLGHTHPQLALIKRYKHLGGEIITVGSDAHVATDITRDFDVAYKILKDCGFNCITTFKNRHPKFVKIG